MIPQLSEVEQRALIESLARQRLRRFRAATTGDRDAVALYLLDAELAAHLHAAVRFAEVALRETVHRALSAAYGERWFQTQRGLLDRRVVAAFTEAEGSVGDGAPAGKIIAQVMLGTWVNLLGKGDEKLDGTRAYYVRDLWEPALKQGLSEPRRDVARLAQRINWARNRISHCEPVVFGLPMPGLGGPGHQVRRSPRLILLDTQELLRITAPGFSTWLDRWTVTVSLCTARLALRALDHIEQDRSIRLER
ncbi:hypothetical protein GSU69_01930 [Rathayibacter festucae]|uniref:CAAX protease n=1 Tax=Rathayibacter festucae TaxID=110937 RepID=A0ABX6GVM2_9MICO|nr:hypothetical protein [Rathayibacter festucae]QHC61582.1 hypothetical protein GSU69_01930 [Rathayibacter festucae]